jgi:hypothetical protein
LLDSGFEVSFEGVLVVVVISFPSRMSVVYTNHLGRPARWSSLSYHTVNKVKFLFILRNKTPAGSLERAEPVGDGRTPLRALMKSGQVTDYAPDMEMGVIRTDDDKRFIFSKPDWLSRDIRPEPGMNVTFDAAGQAAIKVTVVSEENEDLDEREKPEQPAGDARQ